MKLLQLMSMVAILMVAAVQAVAQSDYRIRSGDTLLVEVLEDSNLNRSVLVLPDGKVSFPFAGTLTAAGRTIGQMEAAIRAAISDDFTVEPTVYVNVAPAPAAPVVPTQPAPEPTISIFFVGEVNSPGPQEMPTDTTFLQAIASSGGFSNFAATKRIQLRRTDPHTGLQSVYEINYRALSDGAALRNDFALKDGDVILAPERRLFE